MPKFLLRVEGVNLSSVIDDTDQLSVRRGGGLMVLNAAQDLKQVLGDVGNRLTEIATGASIGLFEFDATDASDAEQVRSDVESSLRSGELKYLPLEKGMQVASQEADLALYHATFVVDVAPCKANSQVSVPQQVEQMAVAKNRWRQLRQASLSLKDLWPNKVKRNSPCSLDRTRPATRVVQLPNKDRPSPVSSSAFERREYGRGARQAFYRRELQEYARQDPDFDSRLQNWRFTDDLQSLSGVESREASQYASGNLQHPPVNLIDKVAVFYVDGNAFGEKGRKIFTDHGVDGYRQWSAKLKEHHRGLLKGLLEKADANHLWMRDDLIRLETLLWGGDEILWVVPAWKGWEVAEWFFSQIHQVKLSDSQTEELTYACGLVFCHSKAPIRNITKLAYKLGDCAKEVRKGKYVHRLAYEVLESVDDIAGELDEYRLRHFPRQLDAQTEKQENADTSSDGIDVVQAKTSNPSLVIDPSWLNEDAERLTLLSVSSDFPTRQLYQLLANWREGKPWSDQESRLLKGCQMASVDFEPLRSRWGDPVAWLHLQQILPYWTELESRTTDDEKGQP